MQNGDTTSAVVLSFHSKKNCCEALRRLCFFEKWRRRKMNADCSRQFIARSRYVGVSLQACHPLLLRLLFVFVK